MNDPNASTAWIPGEGGTWAAVVLVAVGTSLVAAAVVPAVIAGPTNPYAAAGLIVLGLGAIAGACALVAYRLIRRYAPAPIAIVVALGASIPPIAPVFQPGGGDVTLGVSWLPLLGLTTLLVFRSKAAWILAAATSIPLLGLFVLSVVD